MTEVKKNKIKKKVVSLQGKTAVLLTQQPTTN